MLNQQGKKYTDSDFGTLAKRMTEVETLERDRCRDCGNLWWFDLPQSFVCTTCLKTHGKSNSEQDNWKPKSGSSTETPKQEKSE